MKISVALLAFAASGASAYSVGGNRRALLQKTFVGTAAAVVAASSPQVAQALEACPDGSNNCVRTKWTPPAGTSQADAAKAVKSAIEAYPQAGQSEVDGGGWAFAQDNLDASGTARVEYKSSGKGFFAKAFNGGKPFVDDLKIEVESNGTVEVKSQSRIGDSDFGVNGKRVAYLAALLKAQGWSV